MSTFTENRAGGDGTVRVVLVCDRDDGAAEIDSLLAQVRGDRFEITRVRRLAEAADAHDCESFHLLMWDFRLSDTDGFETLEQVKVVARDLPVVVLAESDDAAEALQALRIGVQDYIIRGEAEPAALGRSLRHAIERHRLMAQLRKAGSQARFLATHDGLTRLANRSAFQAILARAMAHAERRGTRLAVLFLDLDGFKHINDTLGHSIGDDLIRQAAKRLAGCVRKADLLARLGGDEFVVMLQDADEEHAPAKVARQLLETLSRPFVLDGTEYWITASIGIAVFPRDGADRDSLIRNADAAMYKAKAAGRNNFQFYSQTMGSAAVKRLDIERRLRRAFAEGRLELHYQPVVDVVEERVSGAEALLRWADPDLGGVAPGDVVAIAEETGLIAALGDWVLETACRDAAHWQSEYDPLRVLVNISAHQLVQGRLRESVVRSLWETGLRPENLDIELTETAFMRNEASAVAVLHDLKAIGVEVSLDDFGTGFSSLSYLKKIPVDTLKIDQSFVRDICVDADDAAITAAILSIAKNLSLKVIAEGVESVDQLDLLAAHGCRMMQGYLFSPPVPADAFSKLLEDGTFEEVFRARRKAADQTS